MEYQTPGVQWPTVTRPADNTDAPLPMSLRACACAGMRSTTKDPGARCAPARSTGCGCRPPVITALLLPSRRAPARGGKARSPNYPGGRRYHFPRRHAAARHLCPRTLPASGVPPARCQRRPTVGRPGRTQPPCGRDRTRLGITGPGPDIRPGCGRACPGLAGSPLSAACCRCCRAEPERGAERPADGSAQRICRFERQRQSAPLPGSTWPLSRASLAAVGQPGASAPPAYPPRECRLPAGLTVCDGMAWGLRRVPRASAVKV